MSDELFLPNVLDVDTLRDLVARQVPVTILDVRTLAEFEAAHIPGSDNVPLDQFPEHARDLGSVIGEPVVLVCRSGTRARQAAEAARTAAEAARQAAEARAAELERQLAELRAARGED